MNTLDDYESGRLYIQVRKHWWHFWVPKQVCYGVYDRIGSTITVTIAPLRQAFTYKGEL